MPYIDEDKKKDNLRIMADAKKLCERLDPRVNLDLIAEYREDKGYTLKDMADYLNLKSPEMYYRRERGQIAFTVLELYKLTYLYDLDMGLERLIKTDL